MIHAQFPSRPKRTGRKCSLGLYKSVVVALQYLRQNHVQQELAEFHDTSQPTISRAITATTPLLEAVLHDWVPTADDQDPDIQLIIDGSLLPCWSWSDHGELWSGKHRTTGLDVQVACTHDGTLAWVSDPTPEKTHDAAALGTSGLLDTDTDVEHFGDKGYVGLGMLTRTGSRPGGELAD